MKRSKKVSGVAIALGFTSDVDFKAWIGRMVQRGIIGLQSHPTESKAETEARRLAQQRVNRVLAMKGMRP